MRQAAPEPGGHAVTGNRELAEVARGIARQAGTGPRRRAALCCALALDESRSVAGARRVLAGLDAIGQTEIKHDALELLRQLAEAGQ